MSFGQDLTHPHVFPEESGCSVTHIDHRDSPISGHELGDISPPEGATRIGNMGYLGGVVGVPNQLNPGQVSVVVELMKKLEKQGLVLDFQV